MQSTPGKITATSGGAQGASEDTSLPDPTREGKVALLVCLCLAVLLGWALNGLKWTGAEFTPSKEAVANFGLFAGFYVAAQVIERLLELFSPLLPLWKPPATATTAATKAAYTKADRAVFLLGLATLLGVGASCAFGLFFLKALGMHVSHTWDAILTGAIIGAGTKPLHDFISLLQNKNNPSTETSTSA
jgi:hypothetical protein